MKFKLPLIFIFSLALTILLSPARGFWGVDYSSLIGFPAYFILTLLCLTKFKRNLTQWQIINALLFGVCIFQLPIRIVNFEASLLSLPDFIFHFLGIFCGILSLNLKNPLNYLTTIVGFAVLAFMFFQGYDLWIHKLNFGSFSGNVSSSSPEKFEAFDENKLLITQSNFNNKIILLDFWHTRCGICFRKFPELQKLYNKYKDDASVIILAVNKPIEEDKPDQAFEAIKQEGYSFPVVIAKDDLPEKLGVVYYPTTFVINRDGKIVFKGEIEKAVRKIEQLKEY